jgi:hypothetical protein
MQQLDKPGMDAMVAGLGLAVGEQMISSPD